MIARVKRIFQRDEGDGFVELRFDYADCVWGVEEDRGRELTLVGSHGRRIVTRERWDGMGRLRARPDVYPVAAGLITYEDQVAAIMEAGRPRG
jgi:hypothetical protein